MEVDEAIERARAELARRRKGLDLAAMSLTELVDLILSGLPTKTMNPSVSSLVSESGGRRGHVILSLLPDPSDPDPFARPVLSKVESVDMADYEGEEGLSELAEVLYRDIRGLTRERRRRR